MGFLIVSVREKRIWDRKHQRLKAAGQVLYKKKRIPSRIE